MLKGTLFRRGRAVRFSPLLIVYLFLLRWNIKQNISAEKTVRLI